MVELGIMLFNLDVCFISRIHITAYTAPPRLLQIQYCPISLLHIEEYSPILTLTSNYS